MQQPFFGEKGIKRIKYLGNLPSPPFGPFVTRKIYGFHTSKNPRLVDLRDLPGLTKQAGRENLRVVDGSGEIEPKFSEPEVVVEPKKIKTERVGVELETKSKPQLKETEIKPKPKIEPELKEAESESIQE